MYEDEPAAAVIEVGPAEPSPPRPAANLAASTLAELFERQTRLTPENVAIRCEGRSMTYRELNARANRLAHLLIARGAGPEQLVALLLPRSTDLVVSVLAVLKAGAGYLPIDPGYPDDRIAFMLDDARPACAITAADQDGSAGRRLLEAWTPIVLDDRDTARLLEDQPDRDPRDSDRIHPLRPMNTAYAIYTSGSTGRPKGVVIPHHSVLWLLAETGHWFGFSAQDVCTLCHSYAFDLSVFEMWGALANGGTLVVVPLQVSRAPEELLRLLVAERVTVLSQTPSAFYALMQSDHDLPGLSDRLRLRVVVFAGEALDPGRLSPWFVRHPPGSPLLVNMYGITETTVLSNYLAVDEQILRQGGSQIGRAIPGLRLYVLDDELNPLPPGVTGELYISGVGVGRGYLSRPGLTAARFVADPFRPGGARMYRSGDLARYDHNGALEYLGRTDHQVKIHGFRIELGEIESALLQHPDVTQAAVLRREDQPGDVRLVAYVVPQDSTPSEQVAGELVSHWRSVYDDAYSGDGQTEPGEDFTVWVDSYTGRPIALDQMREWRDATVARIRQLRPRRVLEIGVGSGLLMWQLAPHCESYWATDFSAQAIDTLRPLVDADPRIAERVTLRCQPADSSDGLPAAGFDTVVINSVVQYFPSADYLVRALDVALTALADGGTIFVGDIRDLRTRRAFHTAVALARYQQSSDLPTIRQVVERSLVLEKELLVAPEFFDAFVRSRVPAGAATALVKRGIHRNELSRHRYDAILRTAPGDEPAAPDAPTVRWGAELNAVADVRRRLATRSSPAGLRVIGIPNARLAGEAAAGRALAAGASMAEVGRLLTAGDDALGAVDPELLAIMAAEAGLEATISPSTLREDCVDVLFTDLRHHPGAVGAARESSYSADLPLSSYTNNPAAGRDVNALAVELRAHVATKLPDYMVPVAVVVLDALPLTINGKLDRAALPAPDYAADSVYRAPRSPQEEALCGIFAEVLGVTRVGIDDSFFDLGGRSLLGARLIARVRAALGAELDLRALFATPTVAGLVEELTPSDRPALMPMPRPERMPLSSSQQSLWVIHRSERSTAYNVPLILRMSGHLDRTALVAAVGDIVARHESLRTLYPDDAGVPFQHVLSGPEPWTQVVEVDLGGVDAAVASAAGHVFDLASEAPLRASLFAVSPDEHVLLLLFHHIAVDGWSMPPLLRDLGAAYRARAAGGAPGLAPLPVQYADYALWQRELWGDRADPTSLISRQLGFWRSTLAGIPQELKLPADRPRSIAPGRPSGSVRIDVEPRLHRRLVELATATRSTLPMVLRAGVAVLLARLGAGADIPIGAPVAGRADEALDDMVGYFVNTLVLRVGVLDDPSFQQLMARVRDADLAAYAHQDVPFEQVVGELNPVRSAGVHPLFQVVVEVADDHGAGTEWPTELQVSWDLMQPGVAKFDLLVNVRERHDEHGAPAGVFGTVEYATDLFDARTVELLTQRLVRLLDAVVDAPERQVSAINLYLPDELHSMLVDYNATQAPAPEKVSVHELFQAQARRFPDRVAASDGDARLTYAELNGRANQVAARLAAAGVRTGDVVGVLLRRSLDLIVGTLAVLKAGAAYAPLTGGRPPAQVRTIMTECGASAILIDAHHEDDAVVRAESAHGTRIVGVESIEEPWTSAAPVVRVDPEQLAYVMFTSGSTGQPKGVAITHDNIVELVRDSCLRTEYHQRVLVHSAYGFDASTYEMWMPLLSGGQAVVVPADVAGVHGLAKVIEQEQVTAAYFTAGLFNIMADECVEAFGRLREVWTGGDVASAAAFRRVLDHSPELRLMHAYGPTETTVWCSYQLFEPPHPHSVDPTLGVPMANTRMYVLDEHLRPTPLGGVGELYVAGSHLARGYIAASGLTATRFVADPVAGGGERMYRTGDLVRWTAHGALTFIGRIDGQVKIRGIRVEPGEIETVLGADPAVSQVAVVPREDRPGDRRLVAYLVTTADTEVDTARLRRLVASVLPDYMVPAGFVELDALPLTVNGKLDRAALPAPEYEAGGADQAPRTPQEEVLCGLFADVLGLPRFGMNDDFFELGGNSLLAIRLVARIRATLNADLDMRVLFAVPTVAGLVEELTPSDRPALMPMPRPERVPLSSGQQRLWFMHRSEPGSAYNVPVVLRLSGVLDQAALFAALADVARRHEPLRTVFPEDEAGVPVQKVLDRAEPWTRIVEVDRDGVDAAVGSAAGHVFDLASEAPLRASLFAVSPDEHVLLLLFHHIAVDGWSMPPLLRDLGAAYRARGAGGAPGLAPLPVQYADYALWQRELLGDRADPTSLIARQLEFWRGALAGVPQELSLPVDRPRPAVRTRGGATARFGIEPGLHRRLVELAAATRTTLPMVLRAGVAVLLARLGAGTDIPIGTSVAGRADEALDDLVGYFVNTLVLRVDTSGDPAFTELVGRVRDADLAAYAHQDVPFEQVVGHLNPVRSAGVHPLFQVVVEVADDHGAGTEWPAELRVGLEWADLDMAMFDLVINAWERHDEHGAPAGVFGTVEYATDLFDARTVELLAQRLVRLLDAVADAPDHPVGAIDLLSPEELREVLVDYNATQAPQQARISVHELFDAQVRLFPDRIAVSDSTGRLTYAELNERANQVAARLAAAGVRTGDVVGVLLRRSLDLIVGTLAVLKAGAAYAPLTGGRPPAQVRTIMTECGASAILIDAHHEDDAVVRAESAHGTRIVSVDGPSASTPCAAVPVVGVDPEQLAYVMFTSGSTGQPKGVAITHDNIVELVRDSCWHPENHQRVLVHSAYGFDASTYEMWMPLLSGGQAVVAPADVAGVHGLAKVIEQEQVTAAYFTTGLFNIMADECVEAFGRLREAWTSGDVASAAAIRRVLDHSPNLVLVHGYGPTETTVWCSYQLFEPPHPHSVDPTLGVPMANTRMYVLDEHLRPTPLGGVGELYVAGPHLARGYIAASGLTATRFVADPVAGGGERMYRTGDLVRWTAHGALTFVGRADGQVKIRGIRVEPGEIETVLGADPAVSQVAVVAREDRPGDRRLVAYLVTTDGNLDAARLRRLVSSVLPDYMVPSAFVELDALPLTVNGKVDRTALPAPEYEAGGADQAPRTPQEEALCGLFAEVLGLPRFGVDDDFFELGGDSLLAVRLVARIRATMNADLDIRHLFRQESRVATLVDHLKPLGAQRPALRKRPEAREES